MRTELGKGPLRKEGYRHGGQSAFAFLFAVLLSLSLCGSAGAARIYPSAGSTSATFLEIGVGARAVSMAGAYTALSDDPYAVYWNPAGLATQREETLAFTHNEYFQGLNQEYFGFTLPGEKLGLLRGGRLQNGTLGLGLNYFYTPNNLERRSGNNEGGSLTTISPVEGHFGAYDLAFSGAYGFTYSENLRLGAAVKVIRQVIDTDSGNTFALDLGGLYNFYWHDQPYTAGFAVQNLGPGVKFISKSFPLPLTFKAGLSHRLYSDGLLLSLDLDKPIDDYPSLALGLDYPLTNNIFLRAGYRQREYGNALGAFSGFSTGIGFVYNQFSFDYAFAPFGDLGVSHRISLAFKFMNPAIPAARTPSEPVPAAERLQAAQRSVYSVSRRPLKISQRGVEYSVEAVSGQAQLARLEFKTRRRGSGEERLEILEGSLPAVLALKLPSGYFPAAAWEFGPGFGGVTGMMVFDFRLPEERLAGGKPAFFYMASSGWRLTEISDLSCSGGVCALSASAPLSAHYVIAVKK